ncbi:MAG: 2-dehydropantoate 2-reductase [Rhizobiaceae bacterium]
MAEPSKIVIAGAGSIGNYVGGCLVLGGKEVALLARPRIAAMLKADGLRVTDLEGRSRSVSSAKLNITEDPATALRGAAIVLVTVKSGATDEMARLVDRFAPADATIISLQNGVDNVARIEAALSGSRRVVAGMVPFNVALADRPPLRAHRATDGALIVDQAIPGLAGILRVEGLPVTASADMASILWGKLLLNLNNALNALSGLPLAEELSDRRWRRLLAAQMDEALAAMSAAGIKPAKLAGAPPSLLPRILRLPDWLFRRIARRMLDVDPEARSSMWDDLVLRRTTEIDEFQGAVLRLAAQTGTKVPLTRRIVELVQHAEAAKEGSPRLRPEEVVTDLALKN